MDLEYIPSDEVQPIEKTIQDDDINEVRLEGADDLLSSEIESMDVTATPMLTCCQRDHLIAVLQIQLVAADEMGLRLRESSRRLSRPGY